MSRRFSKLIFFGGIDEELQHRIAGRHRADSSRPLHFQVHFVVVNSGVDR